MGCVNLLFIAGAGRSGSTLIDRIVGMQEGFCSVGELRFIWERSFAENQLCGCGERFDKCVFWTEVSNRLFGTDPARVDPSPAISLRRSLDEVRRAPWLLQSRRPARYDAALRAYGDLLERLCRATLATSGDRLIVDSSCDATHGLILAQLPGVTLHVVHLVRDPRAVAFSWKRVRKRPEIHWKTENMPVEPVRTSALRWSLQNLMAERLSKRAASYTRLRYEDFAAAPGEALSKVLAPFGWARVPAQLRKRNVTLEPTHTVSGNPMRFKQGPLQITLDDEWRRAMSKADRRVVTAMTLPLLARYGYPLMP